MPIIVERDRVVKVNYNDTPKPLPYEKNDFKSVYSHWDNELKRNVVTSNDPKDYGLDIKED